MNQCTYKTCSKTAWTNHRYFSTAMVFTQGLRNFVPANEHAVPSSSSMRINWLYLASRSDLHGAPVLIWPVRKPTTKSAMKESSVSPDLCDTITPQPLRMDMFAASMASVMEPIWLTFSSNALQASLSSALEIRFVFVTSRSSPTICMFLPHMALNSEYAAQSSWS